jgi:hypothetical protein
MPIPEPTHYRLASAMEIEGVVRPSGAIITAEQFETLKPESQEMLIRDEHLVPCEPPRGYVPPPSPFPQASPSTAAAIPRKPKPKD